MSLLCALHCNKDPLPIVHDYKATISTKLTISSVVPETAWWPMAMGSNQPRSRFESSFYINVIILPYMFFYLLGYVLVCQDPAVPLSIQDELFSPMPNLMS